MYSIYDVNIILSEPTAAQLIPGTPQNIQAIAIKETSALITWDLPVDNGADIIGFVVSYGPMYDPTANTQRVGLNPMEYELSGLETDTQYSVYVTAYNREGQSYYPAEVEFWTVSG